jgi:hypothetical protein
MSFLGIGTAAHAAHDASAETHQGGLTDGVPEGAAKKADHKKLAYISIGVGVVGALIAYLAYRSQSSSSTTTAAAPTSATTTAGTGTVAGYSTDGSQSSFDQAILQALGNLQPTTTPATTTSTTTGIGPVPAVPISGTGASGETQQGSGYWFGLGNETPVQAIVGSQNISPAKGNIVGTMFQWLSPASAAAGGAKNGAYFQPAPGVFVPETSGVKPGTPAFVPISGINHN